MNDKLQIKKVLATDESFKDLPPLTFESSNSEKTADKKDRLRYCEQCGHNWKIKAKDIDGNYLEPTICPNCKTKRWNESEQYEKAMRILENTMRRIRENKNGQKEAT